MLLEKHAQVNMAVNGTAHAWFLDVINKPIWLWPVGGTGKFSYFIPKIGEFGIE